MKRIIVAAVIACALAGRIRADDELAKNFVAPPASARPWVYWFPLSGNLTKEGITADFEAMARVEIGGVLYMEVNQGAPTGAADFAGPLWMEMFSHACREAKRLGLEINMNNDAGWNGSGGPWITPEMSMQRVVWSEVVVNRTNTAPVVLPQPKAEKDFYRDIAVLAMPAPTVDSRVADIESKASSKSRQIQNIAPLAADFKETEAGAVIPCNQVIDLTSKMDRDGKLNWTPPPGNWLVMRFGHTTTGKENHPAPASGMGLECDKLSKAATTLHFENLMGKIIQQNKSLTGQDKALVGVHIDSWENGAQNWTPRMREEFRKRRGYDLLPFLPAFAGRIVGSTEVAERFLWDLRQTVSDMLIENYAGTFRELAHKNGLRLTIEAYGEPADNMAYAGQCDEPMGEFWAWKKFSAAISCTEMASAAHTYGKPIIGAEAFTSNKEEKWLGHPANVKDLGDWAFCEGINRFVFHRYAAQPWTNAAPGMSMGPWGLHYERTQTWWEESKAWHEYLARCQSLLQQGLFVADIAYLAPEGAPRKFQAPPEAELAPHIRSGYGFDGCSAEVVLTRMSVKDGRIVLPDGMNYRALVLPPVETMTPALLAKIQQLAAAGAMIVGPAKPPHKSPSLADLGAGDEKVKKAAADLWASGKILSGKTAQEFLAERGVPPDFSASPLLRYIHRRIGSADVYFVANPQTNDVLAVAGFRVSGKQPELWWPDTGRMESSVSFLESNGVTHVALNLEPSGSVFVVFRKPSASIDPIVELRHEGKLQWALNQLPQTQPAPALKIVKATYGVPGDPKRTRDVTQKLQSRIDAGERQIRVTDMAKGDDPALGTLKTLTVEYTADGKAFTASGKDKEVITLNNPGGAQSGFAASSADIRSETGKDISLLARQPGRYELQTASGKTRTVMVSALPPVQEFSGPWEVSFDPKWGSFDSAQGRPPGMFVFEKLEDWSKRPEEGIRHYSGTATYRKTFQSAIRNPQSKIFLDLGNVAVMAEVKLNGKDLGILWKPPFRVDITDAIKAGGNTLEVKVVNLWINRMIGDEQLPEDSKRTSKGTLEEWPQWLNEGKPSPSGRFTFTSWRLWKKDDALAESGLLGPVTVQTAVKIDIKP